MYYMCLQENKGEEKMKINYLEDLLNACRMIIGTGELLKSYQGMTMDDLRRLIKELREYLDKLDPNYFL